MLTRTSRTFTFKLGPAVIRSLSTYIPHKIQFISKQTQCRLRCSSAAFLPALEEPETTASPPVSLPQELFQLAKEVEKTLEERSFLQFPELYSSFRLVALDCSRNTLIPTSSLAALFPSLDQFYDTARTRLCRNSRKEYAALHVMMYKDAFIIFRDSLSLKHPLLFASESFGSLLDRNTISTANNVFEHIKHLIGMLPTEVNASLSLKTMENWMETLGSSSDLNALTLLQRMVLSLPDCLGIQPSRKHHHYVLKALLKANQAGRAWRWLEKMQFQKHSLNEGEKRHWWAKLPHLPWFNSDDPVPPSSSITWTRARTQDYDLFLTYFAKCGDFMSAQLLMKQMFILGPPILPGQRSWHLYLLAAVSQAKSNVFSVLKEMSDAGFNVNLTILVSLSGRVDLQSWVSEDILSLLRSEGSQGKPEITGEKAVLDLLPDFKPDPLHAEVRKVEVKIPPHLKRLPSPDRYAASMDGGLTDLPSNQAHALPTSEEFGLSLNPFHAAFEKPVLEKMNSQDVEVATPKDSEELQVAFIADPHFSTNSEVGADKLRRNLLKIAQTPNPVNTIRSYNAYISLPGSRRFDIELGSALIRGLCRNTLKAPSRRNVLHAVKMYKDLLASGLGSSSPSFFTPSSRDELKIDPAKELKHVYYMLLRNLTAPPTTYSSGAEAVETQERCSEDMRYLLNEMKIRGITPDSRLISPIMLLQWRSTGSHDEALQFYISFISDIESSRPSSDAGTKVQLMDLGSFRSILNSFGQLSFQNAPITPARLWHVLLSHICARGYISTSKDYALYINSLVSKNISPLALRYVSLGMDPPEEEENMVKSMYDSLKYLFRQITIDIHITPDAVLFNTLMDAFQRVGAFDDALQVLNLSWLTGQVDNVTPIIMFDACGHAKRPVDAYLIWNMLVRRRWKFDKRTLDTWVECLCRLGYVDQACKFVCLYMGKEHGEYETVEDTNPDINTCLILLKFSWNFGQSLEVRERIKSHLPHIWKELSARYM